MGGETLSRAELNAVKKDDQLEILAIQQILDETSDPTKASIAMQSLAGLHGNEEAAEGKSKKVDLPRNLRYALRDHFSDCFRLDPSSKNPHYKLVAPFPVVERLARAVLYDYGGINPNSWIVADGNDPLWDQLHSLVLLSDNDDLQTAAVRAYMIKHGPKHFLEEVNILLERLLAMEPIETANLHPWIVKQFVEAVEFSSLSSLRHEVENILLNRLGSVNLKARPYLQDSLLIQCLYLRAFSDDEDVSPKHPSR
jgi:hypothetical protein